MPLTDVRDYISSTIQNLPYDRLTVRAKVEMNLAFKSPKDGFTATPDLSLFLTSNKGLGNTQIPILVECAFTQDRSKLKKEIDAHLEVVLVIVIIITEEPDYHGPLEESDVWNRFIKEDECREAEDFLSLQNGAAAASTPTAKTELVHIEVTGHVWCNITSTSVATTRVM